ncbi:trypsin-like serine peptidase [Staphylococcus delphini]|uniref:trypsin-like serine peptidase n=1 Tax=Staphylococcus delphini TaxID=53344 RepID=UPI0023B32BBB|nr:trypsin-like peptidase domain-containing protein [Staphylococcus delphini]MDE9799697.1 trypsin-like peptidase domain-containing protein [Staphylococcus delphini]MDE9805468.1 trypsin-like peptidase domain-containing protein [Staphylococcus delphini]
MKKDILKRLIVATSVVLASTSIIGFSETKVHANTEDEAKIKEKQDQFNQHPSNLSEEDFSKVLNTKMSPYNSVGTVYVKQEVMATGVLIGKSTIITNSHVAELAKKDASKVIFTPGTTRTEDGLQITPYGQFEGEEINEAPYGGGTDLAIIKLKANKDGQKAGDLTAPAKIPDNIDVEVGDKIGLIGYPNNYTPLTLYRSGIEVFDPELAQYFGYTEAGNSGSGIFNLQGELVGIHVGKGGKYNLPKGYFFNKKISSLYSVDQTQTTLGKDLKKRAELQAQ